VDGDCTQRSCVDVVCPPAQACANGLCYPSECDERTCGPYQVCYEGTCTERGCATVTCPAGELCFDGVCVRLDAGEIGPTAGGASLRSESYTLDLFVAPGGPIGSRTSEAHQLDLGPGALVLRNP
jgi:hypothetical protein